MSCYLSGIPQNWTPTHTIKPFAVGYDLFVCCWKCVCVRFLNRHFSLFCWEIYYLYKDKMICILPLMRISCIKANSKVVIWRTLNENAIHLNVCCKCAFSLPNESFSSINFSAPNQLGITMIPILQNDHSLLEYFLCIMLYYVLEAWNLRWGDDSFNDSKIGACEREKVEPLRVEL